MALISADYINPFLKAASKVFKDFMSCDLRRGHLTVKPCPSPEYDVALIIGVTGSMKGQVVYSMKTEMANKIVETLNPDIPPNEIGIHFEDTLGEVANMITGNATMMLAKQNCEMEITTPSLITGDAFQMQLLKQQTLGINMYSPFGTLEINVALKMDE